MDLAMAMMLSREQRNFVQIKSMVFILGNLQENFSVNKKLVDDYVGSDKMAANSAML